jgi:hypothetical protein
MEHSRSLFCAVSHHVIKEIETCKDRLLFLLRTNNLQLKTNYFPNRSANLVFRRSAASRYRRLSPAVFKISGRTSFGLLVCSSIATNVTYAEVVCFRSPVIAFSENTSTPTSIEV